MSGVLLNIVTVIVGTAIGLLFGKLIPERFRQIAFLAIGSCTIAFGAISAVGGFTALSASRVGSFAALVLVISLVAGALIGELLRIEHRLEQVGSWLQGLLARGKAKRGTDTAEDDVLANAATGSPIGASTTSPTGTSTTNFADGFMTATIFFCVGAMTIMGSIQAGLGDPSTLYLKSLLDGISAIALTTALGIGVGFSAISVLIIEGGIALCSILLGDFFTPATMASIDLVGGTMLIALGIDIIGIKKMRVGNMLPALVFAVLLGLLLG